MTWLFAVLIVLALGGVAVVAAGRGGSMPRVYDDRPDVRVPAGPLDGADLRRVRFSLAFRGYRMSEVDALLARLADQLDTAAGPASGEGHEVGDAVGDEVGDAGGDADGDDVGGANRPPGRGDRREH